MVVAPGELTDGGEAHGHASLLANLTEQLGLAVLGDVMGNALQSSRRHL